MPPARRRRRRRPFGYRSRLLSVSHEISPRTVRLLGHHPIMASRPSASDRERVRDLNVIVAGDSAAVPQVHIEYIILYTCW